MSEFIQRLADWLEWNDHPLPVCLCGIFLAVFLAWGYSVSLRDPSRARRAEKDEQRKARKLAEQNPQSSHYKPRR